MDGRDASGLTYRQNGYYDANTGQFTQQDPIGIAGGANVYGFAGGDPVNYQDPFGLCTGKDGKELPAENCRDVTAEEGNKVVAAADAEGQRPCLT